MTKVKICGLTTIEDALFASWVGADLLGLVFAPGHRQVDIQSASNIVRSVHSAAKNNEVVGVFVNTPADEVNRIARTCGLDRVQLSGDETWEYCLDIAYPIIKVIHITETMTASQVIAQVENGLHMLSNRDWLCLLDTKIGNAYGGTGRTFDWSIAAEVAQRFPVMIAGGLNPENVLKVIRDVSPLGVDVSTGVETEKRKDHGKIKAFIEAVK